ncbi:glycosyltransferase [Rahnella sp. PCH160]|uniref:glycosyltransferase n=1 Tax=Rahnella sp. PCH160 TaxID=3447928 RepID=UPI0039FDD1D9
MNILIVIDGLPGGGAEKVVLTLAEGFLRAGHRVSLFSLRDVCEYPLPEGLTYRVISDKSRTPWRKITELSRRARLLDQAVQASEEFDLVLSNLHKTDRIVARSKCLPRHKVWFCLHGMFSTSYLGHRTGLSRWMKKLKIKSVYQNRNIVTVSQAVADDLSHFELRPSQLRVIYNPFDIDAIRQAAAQECEFPPDSYLIHVGRFHESKRHDRLIQAYAESHIELPLVLLGQGSEAQTEKLKKIAQDLGVKDKVLFLGFRPNPYPFIRNAAMLVLSSDSEGFGNVLVEALLLATPVVSTRCPGGPAEILKGELARGLAQLNSHDLAKVMADIYQHPPQINQKSLSGFGIKPICEQYCSLAKNA